jgi:AcrR family transcriptional regulator
MNSSLMVSGASPQNVSPASRREQLLDQAAKQLNAKGVLLTSLAEIAAELGISRSAMYYYVADREDLVFQCYRRAAEITARHLHEASRTGGDASQILSNFVTRMLDPNEPEIAARAEMAMLNETQRDTIQGLNDAIATRLAHLLDTGQREGVLRACDVEICARIILSMVTWAPLARPWAHSIGPLGHKRLLDAAIATVLEGLASERKLPQFNQLDLSVLSPPTVRAFDRAAALEAKREALVREASRLFNRKGIDATSLEEIAARVGATKRTLHHHIGSKADLVIACYDRAFKIFFCIKDGMMVYRGSRMEALVAAMHALALAYPSDTLTPLSPLVGFAALTHAGQARIDEHSKHLANEYHTHIRRGIAEGSISNTEMDVEARALMLPGLLSWLVKDDVPTDSQQQQHIARELANIVAVGVGKLD